MRALTGFLKALCRASHGQLFSRSGRSYPVSRVVSEQESGSSRMWWPGSRLKGKSQVESELPEHPDTSLLLTRIGDVMLKCIRSGRPLIHIMRAWSIVGPHFMEVCNNLKDLIFSPTVYLKDYPCGFRLLVIGTELSPSRL